MSPLRPVDLIIMRPGLETVTVTAAAVEQPAYPAIRALVEPHLDGQRLEHVTVLHRGFRADMFVGDHSALGGHAVNVEATRIYRAAWLSRHPNADPDALPAIFGPAVLTSRRIWS